MQKIDLSQYSRTELVDVLGILKGYRTSLKQIGNRARLLDSKVEEQKDFRIEYTSATSLDFVKGFSEKMCKKFFPNASEEAGKNFVVNDEIIGGIRIFYGDDMVDCSFQDFLHAL